MKWAFHMPVIATVMPRGGHTCACVCYTNSTCAGAHTFIMPCIMAVRKLIQMLHVSLDHFLHREKLQTDKGGALVLNDQTPSLPPTGESDQGRGTSRSRGLCGLTDQPRGTTHWGRR